MFFFSGCREDCVIVLLVVVVILIYFISCLSRFLLFRGYFVFGGEEGI